MLKSVTIVPNNPNGATVVKNTGEVYIDYLFWRTASPATRLFALLHEEGHLANNSNGLSTQEAERMADNYAKHKMLQQGYTTRQINNAAKAIFKSFDAPGSNIRMNDIKGEVHHLAPIFTALAGALPSIFNATSGLFVTKEQRRAQQEAAADNNQTLEDLAAIAAQKSAQNLKIILAVVAVLAVTVISVTFIKYKK